MNKKDVYNCLKQNFILFLLSYALCIVIGTVHFLKGSEVIGASALLLMFFGLGSVLGIWNSGKTVCSVREGIVSGAAFYIVMYLLMEFMDRYLFNSGILSFGIKLYLRVVAASSHILIYPLLLTAGYYLMNFLCADRSCQRRMRRRSGN